MLKPVINKTKIYRCGITSKLQNALIYAVQDNMTDLAATLMPIWIYAAEEERKRIMQYQSKNKLSHLKGKS